MPKIILNELAPYEPQGEGANAEGGGFTSSSNAGQICEVTTLEDNDHKGSLRYFVEKVKGPRIVVFRKHGTIRLGKPLKIMDGHITIDGSSAPELGICLRDYPVQIAADDVIMRYVRVRLGKENVKKIENNSDCIAIQSCKRVVLDHLSLSWSIDELLSTSEDTRAITVQWCILSEALSEAGHPEGEHSKAALLSLAGDGALSLHHNVFAHNRDRNPRLNTGTLDIRFNVFYNYGKSYPGLSSENHGANANYVHNYVISGHDSEGEGFFDIRHKDVRMFITDNVLEGDPDITANNWKGVRTTGSSNRVETSFKVAAVEPAPGQLLQVVMEAGCLQPGRDSVDNRIVADVVKRKGHIIDSPSEVGGYPDY
jgi:pectate lyase